MPSTSDTQHLLRRTEYVADPVRVDELAPLSRSQQVENILDTGGYSPIPITETESWYVGVEFTEQWFNRMANHNGVQPRPIREKMAFFWHGHFVSSIEKASAHHLLDQLEIFRQQALGNVRQIAIDMSTTVAMIRYLDNDQNSESDPNQNFGRELMELFLLGVGNYTEADVEASTAAWSGHGLDWYNDEHHYLWRGHWHDNRAKSFLGRTINDGGDPMLHGAEVIETILGDGTVPNSAPFGDNLGRPTREVAAEFLSRKLWHEFAGTEPSATVLAALRTAALDNDFEVRPWLRALLMRDEFYSDEVKNGLVRSPVEFVVAVLHALGLPGEKAPLWLLEGTGQRPLFPPNVSGWKHNSYWISASTFGYRARVAQSLVWRSMETFWDDDPPGAMHLRHRSYTNDELRALHSDHGAAAVVDAILAATDISISTHSRQSVVDYLAKRREWDAWTALQMILYTPDIHLA